MQTKLKTNLAIIGAGPAGYKAAFLAADKGIDVCLIDSRVCPGGVCLHEGCIPSKTLLHTADLFNQAKNLSDFGINIDVAPSLNIETIQKHKNNVIKRLQKGLEFLIKKKNIKFIHAKASFINQNTLKLVSDKNTINLKFDNAIIATGTKSKDIPGVSGISSSEALNIQNIPEKLLIIGAGYIGLEMATIYAKLGSKVTLTDMLPTLLPNADKDLVKPLEQKIKKLVSSYLLGHKIDASAQKDFDNTLIAIGRQPLTERLNLENIDIELTKDAFIKTNQNKQTNISNIYAIGDVSGEPLLAHKAYWDAHIAINFIINKETCIDTPIIPYTLFTDPQLAWVGLTEAEASKQNKNISIIKTPWTTLGKAVSLGRTEGLTKIILEAKTDKILGAAIVGINASELISEMTLAINQQLKWKDIKNTIHPHPTLSEGLD